ncbi:MAG: sodium:calcium antiporter [Azospirillaceae bacterium]
MFLACAVAITLAGTRMSTLADRLADRTGIGEAIVGGVALGIATSLSGVVTSITAAADGHAALAVSNAVGGIAAQTVFLAIADIFYRNVNLEHAAASALNLMQLGLLILMLALPLAAALTPEVSLFAVHPISPVLVVAYITGLRLTERARQEPMWQPRRTRETRRDEPDADSFAGPPTPVLVLSFGLLAVVLAAAGWGVAKTGGTIAEATGLSQSLVGALFTATATSLPELVTTIAAVRRGALTLAVGGIIGGNTFDVLFLVAADIAYRDGSILHAVGERDLFLLVWALIMSATLLLGLLRRERRGPGGIGFESLALIAIYAAGVGVQAVLR